MTALAPPGTADATVRFLWPQPNPYQDDPVGWVHERLGEETWSGQDEILRSLIPNQRTAVRSCHSIGKSHIASRAIAWWVDSHPLDETFVVTTAPNAPQVRAILWRYVRAAHRKLDLDRRNYITDSEIPEWKIDGRLVGWGRRPPNSTNDAEAMSMFQGIHARYLLVVVDEAGGIPDWLYEGITTLVTSPTNRVLAIGNPDDPQARFARLHKPRSGWHSIKISAFDTPAYTGEEVSDDLAAHLVSREWVEAVREEWGEESSLYVAKVTAEFATSAVDSMIPADVVEAARQRSAVDPAPGRPLGGVLALDVARSTNGDTNTLISAFRGRIEIVDQWREPDTTRTADRAERELRRRESNWKLVVDGDGVGGPVYDMLKSRGLNVKQFRGSERAMRRKDRYRNKRAEAYAGAEKQLRAGLWALPPEAKGDVGKKADELALDLSTPKRVVDADGRIGVERKDQLVRRLGRSPDLGDAFVMAVYYPPDERTVGASQPERPRRARAITAGMMTEPL